MASKIQYIANIPGFEYDSQGPLWVDEIVLTSKTSALLHLSDTDSGFNTLTFQKWDNDLLSNNQYSATEEKVDDPKTKEQYSFTLAESKQIRIKSNGSANYFLDYLKTDDSSEETLRQLPGKVIHHYLTWTSHLPDGYPKNFDDYEHRGLCYFKTTNRKERFVVNCKMYSSFNGKKILLQDKDITYDFTGSTVDTGNMEFQHPNPIPQYYDINLGGNADVYIEMPNPNEEENNCLIPVAKYNGEGYIKLEYDTDDKFYNHSEDDSKKYTITSENSQLCILPQAHGDIKNDYQFKDNSVYITNTSKILTCFRYNNEDEEYLTPRRLEYKKSKWIEEKSDLEHQPIAWDYYETEWKRLNAQGLLNHGFLLPNLTLVRSGNSVETDLNDVLQNSKYSDWIYKIDENLVHMVSQKKNIYENFLEPYVVQSKYRSKGESGHLNADYDHGCFGVLYDEHLDDQWFFDKSVKLPKYDKWLDTNFKDANKTSNYQFFLYFLLKDYYESLVKFFDLNTQKQDYVILNKSFHYNLTKSNFKQTDYLYEEAPKVTIANISKCRSELINLIPTEVGIISSIDGYIAQTYNGDINKVSMAKETKPGIHKLSPEAPDSFKDVIMFKDNGNIKTKEFSLKEGSNTLTTEIRLVVHKKNKQAKRGGLVAFLPNSQLVALPQSKSNASSYGVFPSYYPTSILEGEDNNSTQYLGWGKNDRGEWNFVPNTLECDSVGQPINYTNYENLQKTSWIEPTASFNDSIEINSEENQKITFDLNAKTLYVLIITHAKGTWRPNTHFIKDSNEQPLPIEFPALSGVKTRKIVFYTNKDYPKCTFDILSKDYISGFGLYKVNADNKEMFFNTVEHDETSNIVVLQPSDYEDFVVVPAAFCYKEKNIKCGYQTYNHTCVPIFPFCEVLGYYTVDYKKDPTNLVVIDPVNKDACDAFDKKKGNIKARTRI